MITHVDVAQNGHIAADRADIQQTHLGFAKVALPYDPFNGHCVNCGDGDSAAGGGVYGAPGDILIVTVEYKGIDQDGNLGGIGAADDTQCIISRDKSVDHDLRRRRDAHI